jgi:hypothetical protein
MAWNGAHWITERSISPADVRPTVRALVPPTKRWIFCRSVETIAHPSEHRLMSSDSESVEKLATLQTDFEAAAIVAALEEEGIRARAVGGYIAGFRAEVPAGVSVLVSRADLERAKSVLEKLRKHGADVDWSKVDVDNPDETA